MPMIKGAAKLREGKGFTTVGGPLTIACPVETCKAPVGAPCRRRSSQAGPHDRRTSAAPAEAQVSEKDLIVVRSGGTETIAELLQIRTGVALVRRWVDGGRRWAKAREVPLRDIRGPASEDDERAKRASAARSSS